MEKCREEYDDQEMSWACLNCTKLKSEEIHPYTRKLLDIRTLQKAGFPLDPEMLNYEEWLDLGKVNQWLEQPKLF
jgi:hypothetical protein